MMWCDMYIGVSCVEIMSEADINTVMERQQDDKPSTGMLLFLMTYSLH